MVEAIEGAGLSIDGLNAELAGDGITEATRATLDKTFGSAVVEMYLSSLKVTQDAAQADLETKRATILTEVAGENVKGVFDWASKELETEEYNKYRTAINGADEFVARAMMENLTNRAGVNNTAPVETAPTSQPLSPSAQAAPAATGPLSATAYRDALINGSYYKDPAGFDDRRRAGQQAGI